MAAERLITVYIVNHNYGSFIREAVNSVFEQTCQDFELIIIDDGSTDGSREIIEAYAGRDNVTPVFQHNKGLNISNNIALRMARGRYIIRLDADDYFDSHALQILSAQLDRDDELGLVFPDYYEVDEGGRILELVRRHNFDEVTVLDQPAHGACTMIRTEFLRELGGYDEEHRCQDGYDLWVRFIRRYKVGNVNLPLFYYRQHGRSLTRNEERLLETRARILSKGRNDRAQPLSVLGVVPVRGAVTDHNSFAMRPLGGRPLIDWTIESALRAERLAGLVVTTPDAKLIAYIRDRYGDRVMTLLRPPSLAQINSSLEETYRHALQSCPGLLGFTPDALAVLYVDTPFRLPRHVDAAVDTMEIFGTDSVVAVRPEFDAFYFHRGDGLEPLRPSQSLKLEADALYRELGAIHLLRTGNVMSGGSVFGARIGHVAMDARYSHGIASEWDWEVASLMADRLADVHPLSAREREPA